MFNKHSYTKQDLNETLNFIASTLVLEMEAVSACTIRLFDKESGRLILGAVRGSEEEGRRESISLENTYAGQAIKEQRVIYIENIRKAPYYKMSGPAKRFISLLAVPISFKGEMLGVAQLYTAERHCFTEKEIQHAELVAYLAGIGIDRAQSRLGEVKVIFDISTSISSSKSLEKTLKALIGKTAEVLGVERSSLFLMSDDGTKAILKFGYPSDKHGIGVEMTVESCPIFKKIMTEKQVWNIIDPAGHQLTGHMSELAKNIGINAVLFIPLIIDGDIAGVAVFDATGEKRHFSEEEVVLASAAVNFAALTIKHEEDMEEESSLRALGKASAEICHTMRNPLVSIGGFARRIKNDPTSENVEKYADIIFKETARLETLLKDVLRFTDQKELRLKTEDVINILKKVIDLERVGDIKINFLIGDGVPKIQIDADNVKSVFFDLIRNAKEAIAENKNKQGEIFVDVYVKNRYVCVKIANTGPKITKDIQENMFNPFFTTKTDGTGLGLANSAAIIKKHGGKIQVKSDEEKVSFIIKLPKKGVGSE